MTDEAKNGSNSWSMNDWASWLAPGVEFSAVRSGQLDVLSGVQTLTDMAIKALRAAVNDPMIAVQALIFGPPCLVDWPIFSFACDVHGIRKALCAACQHLAEALPTCYRSPMEFHLMEAATCKSVIDSCYVMEISGLY